MSAERKAGKNRIAQPAYSTRLEHDDLVKYLTARKAAGQEPYKFSAVVRLALAEFRARNPVPVPAVSDAPTVSDAGPYDPEAHGEAVAVPAESPVETPVTEPPK